MPRAFDIKRFAFMIVSLSLVGGSARAAENHWRYSFGVSGGYISNLFFSEGVDVSSYGATVEAGVGLNSKTTRTTFDVFYLPTYNHYLQGSFEVLADTDQDGTKEVVSESGRGTSSLSHDLTMSLDQLWTPRLTFRMAERASYSPEQETFVSRPDERFTAVPRARRVRSDTEISWAWKPAQRVDWRFALFHGISRYGKPDLENEPPLADDTISRASAGIAFVTSPSAELGFYYTFTHQISETDAFTSNEAVVNLDLNGDGCIIATGVAFDPLDCTIPGPVLMPAVTVPAFRDESDTHRISTDYSWRTSQVQRASAGVGVFRFQPRNDRGDSQTSWSARLSVNRQFGPKVDSVFGISRDISTFGGLGGSAVGETAFARFRFQVGLRSQLTSTANYTRRSDIAEGDRSVRTISANLGWRQRLGRWGGYSITYSYIDQDVGANADFQSTVTDEGDVVGTRGTFVTSDRAVRYDLIRLGLFFEPPQQVLPLPAPALTGP